MEFSLSAGPIRCKFVDGELRYLTVGDTEIIRRVFFAVRTKTWDTLTPRIKSYSIKTRPGSFELTFEADCERSAAGYDSEGAYSWAAQIVGTDNGTITFTVRGIPQRAFETNRIGLCVLFGTPTVCGKRYEIKTPKGPRTGTFPTFVNAPLMFEPDFSELRYDNVTVSLSGDGLFSMEDQRNFADSSFKAYAVMPYPYPNLKTNEEHTQTITIRATGGPQGLSLGTLPARLTVGELVPGRTLPEIRQGSTGERNWFHGINHDRAKAKAAEAISFAYFPVEHLFDDDTCWENVPVIGELAESARQFAPGKPIDLHHIALTLTHPRPAPEPRNANPMGAAWAAACLKYAALAGVRSTTFDMGPGYANRVLRALSPLAGQPIRQVHATSSRLVPGKDAFRIVGAGLSSTVDAFGVGESIVVLNKTGKRQKADLEGLAAGKWQARELHGQTPAGILPEPTAVRVSGGKTNLNLAPHEVRILTRTGQ